MAYDKQAAVAIGHEVADMVLGLMNGIDASDATNVIELMSALTQGMDDVQADKDAALFHIASGILDRVGDSKVDAPATQ